MVNIIDGKSLAESIKKNIAQGVEKNNVKGILAVILVGDNESSHIYVRSKRKQFLEVGIECIVNELPKETKQEDLEKMVSRLNADKSINGIMVQLPLPEGLDDKKIISLISPEKDVDGLGIYNAGMLAQGEPNIVAATPKGILYMLKSVCAELEGKNAVVVGRSKIVGRPMASLLLNNDCTVTIAHSKTKDLKEITKQADILVVACGCPKIIKKDWVKTGAVVIDVGINRVDGKICGDVDFDEVSEVASYISPVPGGVGPMTVAMLIDNTYNACLQQMRK